MSIIPLKPIEYTFGINLQPNTLLEIEENAFFSIEQPTITVIRVLWRLQLRIPENLWLF